MSSSLATPQAVAVAALSQHFSCLFIFRSHLKALHAKQPAANQAIKIVRPNIQNGNKDSK
jgi:hypothetical protein